MFRVTTSCIIACVLVSVCSSAVFGQACPPVGLASFGPLNEFGFPNAYIDTNGLSLEACVDSADLFCAADPLPFPSEPMSVATGNFPDEWFYWLAGADMAPPGGFAILVLAIESVFVGPLGETEIIDGHQTVFARTRIRVDIVNDPANAGTYTITHPYGVEVFEVTAADLAFTGGIRAINFSKDVFDPLLPPTYGGPLIGMIDPYLTWDPPSSAPPGYLGDPNILHTVTGSPCLTNFFRIEGPNIGGPGVNILETNLFSLMGKVGPLPCGNGVLEAGEQCDDGNFLGGDCCSPTCQFETTTTVCRASVSDCDSAEFCDGAGLCAVDTFQLSGTACGNTATTVCDNPDTCDGAGVCLANSEPSTTECRIVNGDCDVAEFCDGVGSCPVDSFHVPGTSCGNTATSVCDNPDSCDGGGVCLPNLQPVTTLCRVSAGACDVDDFCDGTGACSADAKSTALCRAAIDECDVAETCDGVGNNCPIDDFALAGVACGDPTNSVCDNPDTCNGVGGCVTNPEPATTVCRPSVGVCDVTDSCDGAGACSTDAKSTAECRAAIDACDVAEICNGVSNDCPVNVFAATGVACGDPTATACNNADTCDGSGGCLQNLEPVTINCRIAVGVCDVAEFCDGAGACSADAKSTAECRASAGECDISETCDGIANDCPVDAFVATGTACGDPADTVCDNPDTCDGGGTCGTNFEASTSVCRNAVSDCDVTEFCDGGGRCPNNLFHPTGSSCGDVTVTICDNADTCNGGGVCLTNPEPVTTSCRVSAGECDVVDFCDGAGVCSADAKSTALCRAAVDACDVDDFCDGTNDTCPVNVFAASGVACGDPTDTTCDSADTCDGGGDCLANLANTTTLCRPAVDACDVDDFCDGTGLCSADNLAAAGVACGDPTIRVCDNADTCDGGGLCLTNPASVTIECRGVAGDCDVADFCDGTGACSADAKSTALCRAAVDECDVADFCDGTNDICPANDFAIAGVACGDATVTVCDNADTCDGNGGCQTNPELSTTLCRGSAGVCDVDDFCNGAGACSADAKSTAECRGAVDACDVVEFCNGIDNDCPVNDFAIAGAACGDATVTICDNADTCDGNGGCLSNPADVSIECRASSGQCDVADFCDGAGACSADAKSTVECRAAADACDVAESCDGVNDVCPVNDFAIAGVACGDATVTTCDNADTCDGNGGCQTNPAAVTVLCRISAGQCDETDFCDGAGACSADAKSTAECRAAADACDVAESCDGVGNDCPVNVFAIAGVACGDATVTICDNADSCDGSGGCLTNPAATTVECRGVAFECDAADFCDGAGACSADAKSTALCRGAIDECDVDDFCDGINDLCPANEFALAGVACGDPTVTVCDNADTCDGGGGCLANPATVDVECRVAAGECDAADFCDGAGACDADAKSSALCRAAVDACDVDDFCDGINDICPVEDFAVAGVACGNSAVTVCDDADSCDGLGACVVNNLADGTPCSDAVFCNGGETCLAGVCDAGPAVCTDACETCSETAGACSWCIFDHNLNTVMDGFDFSFFSGCFGVCVPPEDACFAANYDGDPQGCVGGSDFGAFSGCFGLECGACGGCSGPPALGSVAMASSSSLSSASVQLVVVEIPQANDFSASLPFSRRSVAHQETFDVEVWASLTSINQEGLGSVYVDVIYDPSRLLVEEVIPSASFSTFSRGLVDSSVGLVSALGGCAPLGDGTMGSGSTWIRVATLRMRVSGSGFATMTAGPSYGPYGVSVFGRFGDLSASQIEFGEISLRLRGRSIPQDKGNIRSRGSH